MIALEFLLESLISLSEWLRLERLTRRLERFAARFEPKEDQRNFPPPR